MKTLVIYGAGGHAKVVLDALQLNALDLNALVFDENPTLAGQTLLNTPIISSLDFDADFIHVAIGNNHVRKSIYHGMHEKTQPLSITHPLACISTYANIEPGSFIAAYAILGPNCSVKMGTIINHGAIVDHDVSVGCFTHIAPNVTLGGKTEII